MKKIFLGSIILLGVIVVKGQTVNYIEIQGDTFVKITNELITNLIEQPVEEWEIFMQQSNYKKKHEYGSLVVYSKGNRNKRFQAIGKSKNTMLTIDWYDYEEKNRIMTELEKSMEPHLVKKGDNISYYLYNEYFIGIESKINDDHVFERIYVIKK